MARARGGDPAAFEVLLRRHQNAAYGLALRTLGSPADAQDAVQDAFLAAWRQISGFREEAAFGTWLSRIVYRQCLNLVRRRRETVPIEHPDAHPNAHPDAYGLPDALVEHSQLLQALRRALDELSEEQRACWVLREVNGHSYQEVAQIMGVSVSTVRGRLHRARARLATTMQVWR